MTETFRGALDVAIQVAYEATAVEAPRIHRLPEVTVARLKALAVREAVDFRYPLHPQRWDGPHPTQNCRGFHLRDGLCFQRLPDGHVAFFFAERDNNGWWWERMLTEMPVPENEWASVVASMCARGETAETWKEARRFHAKSGGPDGGT